MEGGTRNAPGPGLRARKKQRTKDALARAAIELFERDGYDATTTADIAAEADVAPRTFFIHYPTKEHVLFGDVDEDVAELARRLDERPAEVGVVAVLREWVFQSALLERNTDSWHERRRALIARHASLETYERIQSGRFEEPLRRAFAADLGTDAGDVRAAMVAAAAVAALASLNRSFLEVPDGARLAAFDDALRLIEAMATAVED